VKALALIPSLVLAAALPACSWSQGGRTHHLVFGLGVVTTGERAVPRAGARAARTTEAGLLLRLRREPSLLIGFRESRELEIDTAADIAIDADFTADLSVTFRPSPGVCRHESGGLFFHRGNTPCRESSFFR
jgi:hypothetical protein